jgi:hypothetical protein
MIGEDGPVAYENPSQRDAKQAARMAMTTLPSPDVC